MVWYGDEKAKPKTMSPVEIEQAISEFIEEPFDPIEFPF
jgi:hypothetical protein